MRQRIAFCTSRDGTRIATARHGSGPPLVFLPHWPAHLELDWSGPVSRHQMEGLGERFTVLRYDSRDTGLSDRGVSRVSLDAWVEDLEAVADASGWRRFPLLAFDQGGPIALQYAALHPERVSGIVLFGTFVLGRSRRSAAALPEVQANATLMRFSWGEEGSVVQHLWAARFMPTGTPEQMRSLVEMQRATASSEAAVRAYLTCSQIDVTDQARALRVPTLVIHAYGDRMVPFHSGRELSALVDGARFVPLDSCNHLMQTGEPASAHFISEVESFLSEMMPAPITPEAATSRYLDMLTRRERELVDLMAAGVDNDGIAELMMISSKTVRNHITHAFAKLQVTNRSQAIVMAREAGLGRHLRG